MKTLEKSILDFDVPSQTQLVSENSNLVVISNKDPFDDLSEIFLLMERLYSLLRQYG
jgi:hypothetical protein